MTARTIPILTLLTFVLFAGCQTDTGDTPAQVAPGAGETISLFDGETLTGWHRHEGLPEDQVGGKWEVVDGAIVGDQDPPGHGGFLVTENTYGDYILTLETNLDYPVDSGIFLRVGEDGKSHQITLDYRPNGSIGSVYLPWTQGMVYENTEGMDKFKAEEWNEMKIQIEGEPAHIQVWLNGEILTDYQHTDSTTMGVPREGYIGLQVHPGESYEMGKKVRFRNIQIQPLD